MKIFLLLSTTFVLVATGCTTIQVPLGGVAVGRPHGGQGDFSVRLASGMAELPNVQGTVSAVHNPDGEAINPIPGDEIKSSVTGETLTDGNGNALKESATSPVPVFDLGFSFLERFDVGYNSARGLYGFYDFLKEDFYTLSISPAYATMNIEMGSADLTIEESSDGQDTVFSDKAMEGRSDNLNTTILGSLRLHSDTLFEAAYYAGFGLNSYRVRIKDRRTEEKAVGEQVTSTLLMGLFVKLWIVELIGEVQSTPIEQRDGTTQTIQTTYLAGALSLNF